MSNNFQSWLPTDLKSEYVEIISHHKLRVTNKDWELPKEVYSIEFTNEIDTKDKVLVTSLCWVISLIYKKDFSVYCSKFVFKVIFKSSLEYILFNYNDFQMSENTIHCGIPIEARFPPIFLPTPPTMRVIKDSHFSAAFFLSIIFLILLLISFILSH